MVKNYRVIDLTISDIQQLHPNLKLEITRDEMKIHVQLRDPATNELAKPLNFYIIPSEAARRSPQFAHKKTPAPDTLVPNVSPIKEEARSLPKMDNPKSAERTEIKEKEAPPAKPVKVQVNLQLDFKFKNLSSELVDGEAARLAIYLKTVYDQIRANRPEGFTDDQIYLVVFGDTPRKSAEEIEFMNGKSTKADGTPFTGKDLMAARAKVLADLIRQAASVGTHIPSGNIFDMPGVGGPGGQLRGHGIMATRDLILSDYPDVAKKIGLKPKPATPK